MKFLILSVDYNEFTLSLYAQHPDLEKRSYAEQLHARVESLFGVADFYSSNLQKLGHEAWDIHANNEFLQRAWAKEHDVSVSPNTMWQFARRHKLIPWVTRIETRRWVYEILAAQIKYFQPDVLVNQAMDSIDSKFLKEIKPHVRLMVGQSASPLPSDHDLGCYDLLISSLDNFVENFRQRGIASERLHLAFEPRVLERLARSREKSIAVSFVGGLSHYHQERVEMLEQLCQQFDLQIWGMVIGRLSTDSKIYPHYRGEAWGYDMYRVLHDSKITLNHHGRWAGVYANNCRLYEATGVGALLVTDWKANLHELFEPGKQVVAFRSTAECAELVQYYLEHDGERESIARAGQQKTLSEYTYYRRMQEFTQVLQKYI